MSVTRSPAEYHDTLNIQCIKTSQEKIDRICLHPVLPWIAFADRTGAVAVWNYVSGEDIYLNQLGGSDDGALQEASLRKNAEASVGGRGSSSDASSPAREALLSAKTTASGAINDLVFFDADTVFWQLASQNFMQHDSYDSSSLPSLAGIREIEGHRWIVAACENKVTLHDIISTASFDFSRSACFESKAPTRLAFLILNSPSLVMGLEHAKPHGGGIVGRASPALVVGTSVGWIYITGPTSGTVFAKLSGAHRSAITALRAIGGQDNPNAPDRLLSASADGTVALWDPSRSPVRGSDREIAPIKVFKAHDAAVRDAAFFCSFSQLQDKPSGGPVGAIVDGLMNVASGGASAISSRSGFGSFFFGRSSSKNDKKVDPQPETTASQKDEKEKITVGTQNRPPSQSDAEGKDGDRSNRSRKSDRSRRRKLYLVTVGDDRRVAVWDVVSWTSILRMQPYPAKATIHSVRFAPWGSGGIGGGASILMASGDSTLVLGLDVMHGAVEKMADIQGLVDPGQKKVPKIYHMISHPTRPHLMALATNTGVVLMSADARERPPVVALPAQVLTLEALMAQSQDQQNEDVPHDHAPKDEPTSASHQKSSEKDPAVRSAAGLTYVVASNGKLCSTAYRLESRISSGSASTRRVALESNPQEIIATLDYQESPTIACSATARSISVVWPKHRTYAVYSLAPSGSWEVVDRGSGNCLAWASTAPMYALISVPNVPTHAGAMHKGAASFFGGALDVVGRGLGRSSQQQSQHKSDGFEHREDGTSSVTEETTKAEKKGEKSVDLAASLDVEAAMMRAAAASMTVQVHVIDERTATHVIAAHEINLNGAQPILLHGGALLGLVAMDPVQLQRSLRFFSWRDFSPVGPPLVEPQWVSWEPECTLVALGYAQTIELCRVHPSFQRFATLALPGTQSALWQTRQLFVSSDDAIHVIYADPAQEYVEEVRLASLAGAVASKIVPASEASALPAEEMKPAGPVLLAGVRHSYLWLVNVFGNPYLVSLRHPGVRVRCLAARGELTTARMIAERGLSRSYHDNVARFLAAMSLGDGVKEALLLSGISPTMELLLAVRAGEWNRAATAFQAFALGISDRRLLEMNLMADDMWDYIRYQEDTESAGILTSSYHIRQDRVEAVDAILKHHGQTPHNDDVDEKHSGIETENAEDTAPEGSKRDIRTDIKTSKSTTEAANDDSTGADKGNLEISTEWWEEPFADHEDAAPYLSSSKKQTSSSTVPSNAWIGDEEASGNRLHFVAAAASTMNVVDPSEFHRVCSAAELGLKLSDAAIDAGHQGAARDVLGVLTRFALILPANLLREIVLRMGRCRMTESCRNLAAAVSTVARPGAGLRDASVAALLAALVGGSQIRTVQATLEAAGLPHLSAMYSAAWKQKGVEEAAIQWRRALGENMEVHPPKGLEHLA